GRVAGMQVTNGQAVLMRSMGLGGPRPMTIVLDGMNMGSEFMLDDIVVQDVESVEVLKSAHNTAIYGTANGVLVITTKRGGNSSDYNRYAPGIITYNPKGYYAMRQFYSPKYEADKPDPKPDLRTTVYWNPHVVSDASGNATFNYFNTDMPGVYRILIEGIDSNGNLGRKVFNYEVK
ncbi:MAG: TonB-dependent receptor, partial [Chitinophagaceae bacterium]